MASTMSEKKWNLSREFLRKGELPLSGDWGLNEGLVVG
jgi:hypothetical protein